MVFKRGTAGPEATGTALVSRGGLPWPAIAGGVVVIAALVLWLALRHGSSATAASQTQPADGAQPTAAAPTPAPAQGGPPPAPDVPAPTPLASPSGPRPADVARDLKASLDRQRLWSDVSVQGNALEVRGGSCADPLMGPTLDAAIGAARGAGLTVLRCVSKSGGVVSQRAL